MKLQRIFNEMSWATQTAHPEISSEGIEQTKQWFLSKGSFTPIEGGKFTLVRVGLDFALFRERDHELLGWVMLKPTVSKFGTTVYPFGNIQILPKYRNTAAILILINAMRIVLDHPIYIDDPIFTAGESLLNAIAKRPDMPDVYTIDKKTGQKLPYTSTDLQMNSNIGILVEQTFWTLSHCVTLPGGKGFNVVLEFFTNIRGDID